MLDERQHKQRQQLEAGWDSQLVGRCTLAHTKDMRLVRAQDLAALVKDGIPGVFKLGRNTAFDTYITLSICMQ